MIDEKWSGVVDLFTYDEHFFIGFEIHKGQVLSTRKMEVEDQGSRKLQVRPEQMDYRCSTITTDWYQISYAEETNTWVIQTLSPTRTTTCSIGGTDTSDLGYTGSSYTYGDTSPWGGGDPNYSPPPVPEPKLTIYIDISISSDSRLSCIVDKLSMSEFVNCVADFTKTGDQNTNTTLKLGKTELKDGEYANGQTQKLPNGSFVITISEENSQEMKSLEFAKTIFHEIMHAEIYRALQNNGITPIDGNFPANMDKFVKIYTQDNDNDRHHTYMAEVLLPNMAAELMEIHKTQFSNEFYNLNEFVKKNYQNIYPKGLSSGFYENLLWGGMKGTRAYEGLKASSSWEKYEVDISQIKPLLTQGC